MKKISIIGLGYIGLPTALMFAKAGYEVTGVDVNPLVIDSLNSGNIHIEENGLNEIYSEVKEQYRFTAKTVPVESDAYIIAVPTPITDKKTADLTYVVSAVTSILPLLKSSDIVIVESTIPPRTTVDLVAGLLQETGLALGKEIFLAHCPERVLPGNIFNELVHNNRIIGGYDPESAKRAAELYKSFVQGEIIVTDATSAEMAKLMENTYRDVNIALANELAKISAEIKVDALEVIKLANKHPRVNLHAPGPGVGGHCIAVDPYFVIEKAPSLAGLMSMAREINNSMPAFVVSHIERLIQEADGNRQVAILGLTYKGNIDDVRESPAIEVVELLREKGYSVKAHDPHVRQEIPTISLHSLEAALQGSSLAVILSDHHEFKQIGAELFIHHLSRPIVFDTKNCYKTMNRDLRLVNYSNLGQ